MEISITIIASFSIGVILSSLLWMIALSMSSQRKQRLKQDTEDALSTIGSKIADVENSINTMKNNKNYRPFIAETAENSIAAINKTFRSTMHLFESYQSLYIEEFVRRNQKIIDKYKSFLNKKEYGTSQNAYVFNQQSVGAPGANSPSQSSHFEQSPPNRTSPRPQSPTQKMHDQTVTEEFNFDRTSDVFSPELFTNQKQSHDDAELTQYIDQKSLENIQQRPQENNTPSTHPTSSEVEATQIIDNRSFKNFPTDDFEATQYIDKGLIDEAREDNPKQDIEQTQQLTKTTISKILHKETEENSKEHDEYSTEATQIIQRENQQNTSSDNTISGDDIADQMDKLFS